MLVKYLSEKKYPYISEFRKGKCYNVQGLPQSQDELLSTQLLTKNIEFMATIKVFQGFARFFQLGYLLHPDFSRLPRH